VNAYYGCSLYAEATHRNRHQRDFARLLLAMEIQSVETYWHMPNQSQSQSPYDSIFSYSRMVGNMGATDVTSTTWFGAQPAYVHGINMYVLMCILYSCVYNVCSVYIYT